MQTWQAVKMLTENPNLKFKNNKGNVLEINRINDNWTLVQEQESVDFAAAIRSKKKMKIKHKELKNKKELSEQYNTLENILYKLQSYYNSTDVTNILQTARFYIEQDKEVTVEKKEFNDVLYAVCRNDVSIKSCLYPISSKRISKFLGVGEGKVRYQLNKLKEDGLVVSYRSGGQTEDGKVFCMRGYITTEQAKETQEYKKAYKEEKMLCKKCFNIDI